MKSAKKKPRAAKLRNWRASVIRKRGQYLGTDEAPNEKAAEAAAVAEFDLSDEQRRRLVVSEGGLVPAHMKTRTHFAHRIDILDAAGESGSACGQARGCLSASGIAPKSDAHHFLIATNLKSCAC